MKLLLPLSIADRLARTLKRNGSAEVGGILMGEHVDGDSFRIVEFSTQSTNNTSSSFLRVPSKHSDVLDEFFKKTGYNYEKYNYLGEWHSHPSFAVHPSDVDVLTMRNLVEDNTTSATFAVLMIIRLARRNAIEVGAWLFIPNNNTVFPIQIILEDTHEAAASAAKPSSIRSYGRKFLGMCGISTGAPALRLIPVTNSHIQRAAAGLEQLR